MDADEPNLQQRAIIPQHVVHRAFATETVLLNLQSGKYHGLNPTGGRMLELIERHASLATVATQLSEIYERPLEEMQADLLEFCSDMSERGLIALAPM